MDNLIYGDSLMGLSVEGCSLFVPLSGFIVLIFRRRISFSAGGLMERGFDYQLVRGTV